MADKRSSYRVVAVGVGYYDPTEITDSQGNTATVAVRREARNGDTIELTKSEADRLLALEAVVSSDAPETYREMQVDDLQAEADSRGLTVEGTGANGNVLKEDLVTALEADDASKGVESA
jgi:hypothetical protein